MLLAAGAGFGQQKSAAILSEPVFRSAKAPAPKLVAPPIPPAPPLKPNNRVAPAQAQEPTPEVGGLDSDLKQYQILLEPPSAEALFGQRDSERQFEQRMRQQARQTMPPNTVRFPDKPVLSTTEFAGRSFPEQAMITEPHFVCHNRLYFEEKNAERYGWDLGFIQPFVSTLYFYRDVVFLPHNFASHPTRRYECNAGYCLPGDPVPYIIYPPDFTLTGGIAEGALAIGLFAVIP